VTDQAREAGEVTARGEYHCPACGAEAQWNPGKGALVCIYCGMESKAELQQRDGETVIVEHDLVAAMRGLPDSARGWQAEKTSVRCQSCQAISVFDPDKVGQRCDFCGSAALVPYEQVKDAFRPESLLPMAVSESQARELMRGWLKGRWFAPNGFAAKALADRFKGLYLPYWTFDAQADASWTAEAGYHYYVEVNGKKEQRTRWERVSGSLSHFFDDQLVCASKGVDAGLLRGIEPFPTEKLIPYDPGYLSGWLVERYQIDLGNAAQTSRQRMEAQLREMCARQVPGDTHRSLSVHAQYSGLTFKHILAPLWLCTYNYQGKPFQLIVNGVTGAVNGRRPWSWIKITLAVIAALIVLMVVFQLVQ
jgi:hypothetical protein